MKTLIASGVVLACLIPLSNLPRAAEPQAQDCENLFAHEPAVVFEVSGSTLAGPVDTTLTVYTDGIVKISSASASGPGKAATAVVTADDVEKLRVALVAGSGLKLCDDPRIVTDAPLHTVTLLSGLQDAQAHTFSYWVGTDAYTVVDQRLQQFVQQVFPEF